jgi:hypothetical protein
MVNPAIIFEASLESTTIQPLADVVFTLKFTIVNSIPAEGAFIVTYPQGVKPAVNFKDCSISVNTISYRRSCTLNSDARSVTMRGGLPNEIPVGAQLVIVIGTFINPASVEPNSFLIKTYLDNDATYVIDEVKSGLAPNVICNFPCKDCKSAQHPNMCTECFTDGETKYQFYLPTDNTCQEICPDGTYSDEFKKC